MANDGRSVMVQGRIVWTSGDLFKGQVKNQFGTQTPQLNKQGETQMQYGFGLAVPKSILTPENLAPKKAGEFWVAMHEEAYTLFPSRQIPPGFAMKFKDGDGIDQNGVPFAQREGYAGHIILACTTSLPIKYFKFDPATGQNFQINEGIKCGDYVNVQLSIKAHPAIGQGKAGLYLNPNAVQFLGYGKEIINAPSGDQIFGAAPPPMPTGASATPIASTGFLVPPTQGVQQSGLDGLPAFQPFPQQQSSFPQQPQVAPVQPHFGVLPPAQQVQFQQPAVAPQGFPTHPMTPPQVPQQGYPQQQVQTPQFANPSVPTGAPGFVPQGQNNVAGQAPMPPGMPQFNPQR